MLLLIKLHCRPFGSCSICFTIVILLSFTALRRFLNKLYNTIQLRFVLQKLVEHTKTAHFDFLDDKAKLN